MFKNRSVVYSLILALCMLVSPVLCADTTGDVADDATVAPTPPILITVAPTVVPATSAPTAFADPTDLPAATESPGPTPCPDATELPPPTDSPAPTHLPPPLDVQPLSVTLPALVFMPSAPNGQDQWIPRVDGAWAIRLENPNPYAVSFELSVRLNAPMASEGERIGGDMMFVTSGSKTRLTGNDVRIAHGTIAAGDTVTFSWPANEGFLFYLPGEEDRQADCHASLLWGLRVTSAE